MAIPVSAIAVRRYVAEEGQSLGDGIQYAVLNGAIACSQLFADTCRLHHVSFTLQFLCLGIPLVLALIVACVLLRDIQTLSLPQVERWFNVPLALASELLFFSVRSPVQT